MMLLLRSRLRGLADIETYILKITKAAREWRINGLRQNRGGYRGGAVCNG